jgi:hypothetical protein
VKREEAAKKKNYSPGAMEGQKKEKTLVASPLGFTP